MGAGQYSELLWELHGKERQDKKMDALSHHALWGDLELHTLYCSVCQGLPWPFAHSDVEMWLVHLSSNTMVPPATGPVHISDKGGLFGPTVQHWDPVGLMVARDSSGKVKSDPCSANQLCVLSTKCQTFICENRVTCSCFLFRFTFETSFATWFYHVTKLVFAVNKIFFFF